MNEIDRIIHLPVRLKYSLSGPLKDMLNVMLAHARLEHEVSGMIRAVASGYQRWCNFIQDVDTDIAQARSAFVRTLAIAIPDLFVVAWDQHAFEGYELDENERKVLDSCREDFNAKLAVAEATGRLFNQDMKQLQWKIIKESPALKNAKGESPSDAADFRGRHRHY